MGNGPKSGVNVSMSAAERSSSASAAPGTWPDLEKDELQLCRVPRRLEIQGKELLAPDRWSGAIYARASLHPKLAER